MVMRILFISALLVANSCFASLYINEIQSGNTIIPDDTGQTTTDWVEIYNSGPSSVNLKGYHLSDSASNPTKWSFPDDTIIPAGGHVVVWASNRVPLPTSLHSNWAISAGGEPILLSDPQGNLLDQFPSTAIPTNVSMGRKPDGTGSLHFFNQPTPGAANTTTGSPVETLAAPAFSVPGGMHTSAVSVAITTAVSGGTIRYTLDGSDPTESSPVYTGPINLDSRTGDPNVHSAVPTNYLDTGGPFYEGWQPPDGEVFKINVLRARVFKAGSDPGRITTQSYLIDPAGASRYPYPVVSIATTPANLFSNETGIYVPGWYNNFAQEGSAWERPGHIEFYETDGSLAFHGEIGMRIHGNTTVNRPRKALRIYNRNPDGPATFNHRIFPEKDVSSFDTFLLRAGGNDWGQSFLRDALVGTIAAHTGLDRMASRPAAVFIDGEYWGIHNVRDRIDEGYYLHHYGLTDTQFTQLEVGADGSRSWPIYDRGEPSLLSDFTDILDRAWAGEFATAQGYASLTQRIDIDNFIDYQIHEIWAGNTDWPGNNVRLWRAVTPDTSPGANPRHDGRWRWILYDTDFGLGLDFYYVPGVNEGPNHDTLSYASLEGGGSFIGNREEGTRMLRKTLENAEFRGKFINRFADLLNSSLSSSNAGAKLDAFEALYAQGMTEHVKRWRQPFNWTNDISRIRNYIQQRPAAVRGHIANRFGLAGTAPLTIGVSGAGQGTVRVNTLDLAPGTEGVAPDPYPWTGTYFRGVPVTLTAQPGPGYRFVSWTDSGTTNTNGATVLAADSTANYGAVWTNNPPNGGTGFNPWVLTDTGSFDDGFFIGSSGRPIHSSSPDGRSFGIYGHSGGSASATRPFASGALQTNRTFSVKLSPGGFSGTKGILLGEPGTNRFGFTTWSTNGSPGYWFRNGDTETSLNGTFAPDENSTFDVSVTRLGNDVHRMTIVRNGTTFTTNFTATGTVDRAVFFHTNSANSSDTNNLYFNLPTITETTGVPTLTNTVLEVDLAGARSITANFAPEAASSLAIESPAVWALGTTLPEVRVLALTGTGDPDPNFAGTVTLVISGPGGFSQQFNAQAVEGVAVFPGLSLPAAGNYTLGAVSGALSTGADSPLAVNDAATFLPAGNGTWNEAANWDIAAVPNSATARVRIPTIAADRNVNLTNHVTAAAIIFDNGAATNRNRIRNNNATATLTLQAGVEPASITVNGSASGHANLEFTNAGSLVLAGDVVLDVQNAAAGNAEYGALRLQGNVGGPGGIIKRGPGMAGITGAGKTFSGNVVIEQGVLTFSEPALTGNGATNYTVQPGGQLRLSSAFATAGVPRTNHLKGPLNLAGAGRSGVPDSEGFGVLGALRLETGSTGTTAVLTNAVNLTANADIHAAAGNGISLQGPLQGTSLLSKSGGGTLTLGASASGFAGGIGVNRGTLALDAAAFTDTTNSLTLAAETTLAGNGRWNGMLQAQDGSALSFVLGASPAPGALLRAGHVLASGTVTVAVQPAPGSVEGTYPLLAVDGSFVGTNNLALSVGSTNFPASALVISNQTLSVSLRAALTDREQWLGLHGLPTDGSGDGADDADPDGDGIANIFERAFFLSPVVADGTLPVATATPDNGVVVVTYRTAKNQADLTVTPETNTNLLANGSWTPATPAVVDDTHPDYTVWKIELPAEPGAGFVRFKVSRQ